MFKQRKFFLYDESNYVNHTLYTELNKKLQISGLIWTSPISSIKTTNLIGPESSSKIRMVHNKYMDHIVLQLEDIRKPGKIERKDAKVTNFSSLSKQNLKEKLAKCQKQKCLFK